MSQRIHNGAIVVREGRLLLFRQAPASSWELPGGPVLPEHPDVDEAMDQMLREIGIRTPAIEEDFVETIYLRDERGHVVYNIYAASEWEGEPEAPAGTGSGWFSLEELDAVAMDTTVRDTLFALFGVRERRDDAAEILAALSQSTADATEPATLPGQTEHGSRAAGFDVLRTLRGRDPQAAFAEMRQQRQALADDIVDFALGEVWAHPALDRRTRSLQVVAMLGALGRTGPLRSHLQGALNHGATPEQLVQTMRMVAVYAGFPAALEAWDVLRQVFAERGIAMPGEPS
jgi:4-carboxymuconolactone decarboxylase